MAKCRASCCTGAFKHRVYRSKLLWLCATGAPLDGAVVVVGCIKLPSARVTHVGSVKRRGNQSPQAHLTSSPLVDHMCNCITFYVKQPCIERHMHGRGFRINFRINSDCAIKRSNYPKNLRPLVGP